MFVASLHYYLDYQSVSIGAITSRRIGLLVVGGYKMKFLRYMVNGQEHSGTLEGTTVREIGGEIFTSWSYTGKVLSVEDVRLLAPLKPNQVIGIGSNDVATEEDLPKDMPEIPIFFFKPISSVIGHGDEIVIPPSVEQVKFEAELAVVIGKEARNIAESDILDYCFGYTIANDVTAPQFFQDDGHWMIGKSFDTFTPLGPVIETELDPFEAVVKTQINGEEKENRPTNSMIVPIREMLAYLSRVMTLKPGDVILTGSPFAHTVSAGTVIECCIEEVGVLRNTFI